MTPSTQPSGSYGYCPICGKPGMMRERRPNGNDRCEAGHEYPSKDAKDSAPTSDTKNIGPHDLSKSQLIAICCFYAKCYQVGVDEARKQGFEVYQYIPLIQGTINQFQARKWSEFLADEDMQELLRTVPRFLDLPPAPHA